MSRILKIVGWLVLLSLLLGVGAVVGGGIVYATQQADVVESTHIVPTEQSAPEPGIVIASVVADAPADQAGVKRGDILLQIDGDPVDSIPQLMRVLAAHEPSDEVELTLLHGDDERTLTATLDDQEGRPYLGIVPCGKLPDMPRWPEPGMTVHVSEPGVTIICVEPDSPADQAGLQIGDVIISVDDQELDWDDSLSDVIAAYEPGDTVSLKLGRPGDDEDTLEVTVELGEHPEKEGTAYLGVRYHSFSPFGIMRGEWPAPHWPPTEPFFPKEFPFDPDDEAVHGAVVHHVEEDSPAMAAGLQQGDLIMAVDDDPIEGPQGLAGAIAEYEPGDQVTLTVFQAGDTVEQEIKVVLAAHPEEEEKAYLGVTVSGYIYMHHFDNGQHHELDLFVHPEVPFGELPFDFEIEPHHFELHFPDEFFDHIEMNCCEGSV
jgi:S1-C subfamily serine protease